MFLVSRLVKALYYTHTAWLGGWATKLPALRWMDGKFTSSVPHLFLLIARRSVGKTFASTDVDHDRSFWRGNPCALLTKKLSRSRFGRIAGKVPRTSPIWLSESRVQNNNEHNLEIRMHRGFRVEKLHFSAKESKSRKYFSSFSSYSDNKGAGERWWWLIWPWVERRRQKGHTWASLGNWHRGVSRG